jgi:N-acyl homoserine lactone hydrolase
MPSAIAKGDRDAILGPRPAGTRVFNGKDHDVFGDGTVVIKSTPGHTPGPQSLFLKLANTGDVQLSGALYHYPEEITYKKVPNFDTVAGQTALRKPGRFGELAGVGDVIAMIM